MTPRSWPGDTAFDADDFALAESHYKEAAHLSPSDAAPLVGLARVAIAKTNVATDYNASPRNPALEKVATQLRQAVKLDPTFAPAHTELGRVLLILGKADEALASFAQGGRARSSRCRSPLGSRGGILGDRPFRRRGRLSWPRRPSSIRGAHRARRTWAPLC